MSYLLNSRINSLEVALEDTSQIVNITISDVEVLSNLMATKANNISPVFQGVPSFNGCSNILGISTNRITGLTDIINSKSNITSPSFYGTVVFSTVTNIQGLHTGYISGLTNFVNDICLSKNTFSTTYQ